MTTRKPSRFVPSIDALEDRCLMAAKITATLAYGVLNIEGTEKADQITVRKSGSKFSVDGTTIKVNGKDESKVGGVSAIHVNGLGGSDTINLADLSVGSIVWGGKGDDVITGTANNDLLYGEGNNDTIYGGKGSDTLWGQGGDDVLYGQEGRDTLSGGEGRDEFYGGGGFEYENFDTYTDVFDFSKPIFNTASKYDIVQGEAGNCQTLAAMATMASQGGTDLIEDHIRYKGNYLYQVRLHGEGKWVDVYFNGTWSDNDPKPNGQERSAINANEVARPEFWTVLMSRARLSTFGISSHIHYTQDQWREINDNYSGRLSSSADALHQFTGWKTSSTSIDKVTFEGLQKSLDRGDWLIAGSFSATSKKTENTATGIVGGHAYAITRVFTKDGRQFVELYNPWGVDGKAGRKIDNAPGSKNRDDGVITLAWSDFANSASFSYVYSA